jgi:DNA-binding NarL/FixJ family response regulator
MTRPRVIVADDHQALLERVGRELAGEFNIIASALDGQQAFDAAIALQPDAVVLDISMPCLNGLEVARLLSVLPNPPRIVFLTAHDDPDFRIAAEAVGAAGYVLKGNVITHLAAALREALRR